MKLESLLERLDGPLAQKHHPHAVLRGSAHGDLVRELQGQARAIGKLVQADGEGARLDVTDENPACPRLVRHRITRQRRQDPGQKIHRHYPLAVRIPHRVGQSELLAVDAQSLVVRAEFELGLAKIDLQRRPLFLDARHFADEIQDLNQGQIFRVSDDLNRKDLMGARKVENEIVASHGARGPEDQN